MEFHTFGNKSKKPLLIMHGMLCDWRKFYNLFKNLENEYYLIFPAMTGFYDNSPDFVSFAEECSKIEKYINKNFDGKLYAVLGFSQGATLMSELLARNNVKIEKAILDGIYVAHQGKFVATLGVMGFTKMQKNGGKLSKRLLHVLPLMGLEESDVDMFDGMYWRFSKKSLKANLYENYTYRANPDIAKSKTKIYLLCGSKEPYALKSHKILKKYLKRYKEHIFKGYGHCQFMAKNMDKYQKILNKILL